MARKYLLSRLGIGIAIIAAWFLLVDLSVFIERRPDCYSDRAIRQIRFARIPVHEKSKTSNSDIQIVATDLGVPCSHNNMQRWHKYRFWGLALCSCPCISGTVGLSSDHSWYQEDGRQRLINYKANHPEAGNEFRQRVLVEHDLKYWRAFCDENLSTEVAK